MTTKIIILFLFFALFFTNVSNSQWLPQTINPPASLHDVSFINANTGWVLGLDSLSYIYFTTNGGNTWSRVSTITNFWGNSIYFYNQSTGWTCGSSSGGPVIYRTTNGGINWSPQYSIPNTPVVRGIYFINDNTGWALPSTFGFHTILKTTNSGVNWTQIVIQQDTSANPLISIYFVNANTGWVAQVNTIIWKTTNGGLNWTPQNSGFDFYLGEVQFIDANTGFLTANNSNYWSDPYARLLKTTNGGSNWFSYDIQALHFFFSLYFIDVNTGWVAGWKDLTTLTYLPRIFKTTNGGINWYSQYSGIDTAGLSSIIFTNAATGYSVGGHYFTPLILKTTNGGGPIGIKPISTEIPTNYNLHQNYPNPFNPVTNIQFDIPKSTFVGLIVYDALGREVTKLVNEELKPGSYEVDWNTSNYPSGVYFYKIQAGDFTETKKMVLLK